MARESDNLQPKGSVADLLVAQIGQYRKIVAGMGLDEADGEDVLQEVFLLALEHPIAYGQPEEALRWLTRVTVNQCLQRHRQRRREYRLVEGQAQRPIPTVTPPDEIALRAEELERIRGALDTMNPDLLTPLVLRYFCDMNSTQIGHTLDLSPATVRSRLMEARIRLAKRLLREDERP